MGWCVECRRLRSPTVARLGSSGGILRPSVTSTYLLRRVGTLDSHKQRARETVERAFNDVPRPNTSLRQFLLIDRKGMAGTITDEEWRLAGITRTDNRWQDISDLEMEHCGCQLAHMQAAEFRYYLPAYMVYSLALAGASLLDSAVPGGVIFGLTPSKSLPAYSATQYELLDQRQHSAINEFLGYMASHANEYDRRHADYALTFWGAPGTAR